MELDVDPENKNKFSVVYGPKFAYGNAGDLGYIGSVSIHGHPTGLDNYGDAYSLDPTESIGKNSAGIDINDNTAFLKFSMNIIVGLEDVIDGELDSKGNEIIKRVPMIRFFDRNSNNLGKITEGYADIILSGDRGALGRKFDKKKDKKDEQDSNKP